MPRLLSVALTEAQVLDRTKTVTRRLGWWRDVNGRHLIYPGDELDLCRKVMGRRKGEPLVRLCRVRVVDVKRERLELCTDEDAAREGFPDMTGAEFVDWWANTFGIHPVDFVTRIEWEYL